MLQVSLTILSALLVTVQASISSSHTKGIQIRNKGQDKVWIVMTEEESFNLSPGQMASILLEGTWSGTISARSEECEIKTCNSPYTVADLNFGAKNGEDHYRVSVKDGFNKPITITPTSLQAYCKPASCSVNLNEYCPLKRQVKNDDDVVVACRSAPEVFQEWCPQAVTSEEDQKNNTFSCKTSNTYVVSIG